MEERIIDMDPYELNNYLASRSYVNGFSYSYGDLALCKKVCECVDKYEKYLHVMRWLNHAKSLSSRRDASIKGDLPPAEKTSQYVITKDMSLDQVILDTLSEQKEISSLSFASENGLDHQKLVGAIKSLLALPTEYIKAEQKQISKWELTNEGKSFVANGSYEFLLYSAVTKDGILQKDLMKMPNAKIGFSKAMTLGWLAMDKKHANGPTVFRKVDGAIDVVKAVLVDIENRQNVEEKKIQDLKKRKLITPIVTKFYSLTKGSEFKTTIERPEADLTADMLQDASWKKKSFKDYNFEAKGAPVTSGYLHPLLKVRTEFRRIFLDMGFSEMPTNRFVENGFWNFDALFQPQQHPARDAHDTFFISDPEMTKESKLPSDYLERVKTIHESGGYGSTGYNYDWKIAEAQKNILRTHTTAVSARMLYALAQQKEFKPVKMFSIDRVFRNETLDATHLAEFHQIEGLVADRNLTLGHLIGTLYAFFKKLGLEKLKFKPAYNPYTEPSMEIFSYHPGLKKWVEIGNSGMFRPEMLLPMGIPKDVNVIAWGLSLERPTMIKYGINNIRELIGPKVNLNMVQENPICRLNKI